MRHVINWLCDAFRTKPARGRARAVRPQLEQLDQRLVPSATSAIATHHTTFWGFNYTQRDFYAIGQNNGGQVIDFRQTPWGTSPTTLTNGPQGVTQVSATIDPSNGNPEVFALDGNQGLWLYGSNGAWKHLYDPGIGIGFNNISATRDGHVYTDQGGGDIKYIDSNGNMTDLGRPVNYGYSGALSFSAGLGWYGQNEVFAVGWDHALYVNSSNTSGGWRLVDNSASFNAVAATQTDQAFALDSAGRMHQESERTFYWNNLAFRYWSGQDVSLGMTFNGNAYSDTFPEIYADTDASGQAEVYAFSGSGYNQGLYRYTQVNGKGSWNQVDSQVWNAAAADGGYFFDVNYGGQAWANSPSSGWTPIGNGVL